MNKFFTTAIFLFVMIVSPLWLQASNFFFEHDVQGKLESVTHDVYYVGKNDFEPGYPRYYTFFLIKDIERSDGFYITFDPEEINDAEWVAGDQIYLKFIGKRIDSAPWTTAYTYTYELINRNRNSSVQFENTYYNDWE